MPSLNTASLSCIANELDALAAKGFCGRSVMIGKRSEVLYTSAHASAILGVVALHFSLNCSYAAITPLFLFIGLKCFSSRFSVA